MKKTLFAILFLAQTLAAVAGPAQDQIDYLRSQIKDVEARNSSLQAGIRDYRDSIASARSKLSSLRSKQIMEPKRDYRYEIQECERTITERDQQLATAQKELNDGFTLINRYNSQISPLIGRSVMEKAEESRQAEQKKEAQEINAANAARRAEREKPAPRANRKLIQEQFVRTETKSVYKVDHSKAHGGSYVDVQVKIYRRVYDDGTSETIER